VRIIGFSGKGKIIEGIADL